MEEHGALEKISVKDARGKNSLVLAYVGDTVFDLYVRTALVKKSDSQVKELNRTASGIVNARSQAQAADKLWELLSETEQEIYKRGRNAYSPTIPKNMTLADYKKATGLEAVIGYLFLGGEYARLEELMDRILKEFGVL